MSMTLTIQKCPNATLLENAFRTATRPINWLVITHNDPQLLHALKSGMKDESAAFLTVSQESWDFEDPEFAEAIDRGLHQADIQQLLLVGGPRAVPSFDHSVQPETAQEATTGYAKLLAGAKLVNKRDRQSREWLAQQTKMLLRVPAVHTRWSNGKLDVTGLYHRSESGLFLAYDVNRDRYHALTS